MRKLTRKEKYVGQFFSSSDQSYTGELIADRKKTNLYIEHPTHFDFGRASKFDMKGVLNDGTRLSLLQCISTGTGTKSSKRVSRYFANVFPHYILYGDHHISSLDKSIRSISFTITDASILFHDSDAFGNVYHGTTGDSIIEQLVKIQSDRFSREIKTGPEWFITYFNGIKEIVNVKTDIGLVNVSHSPLSSWAGPEGVNISNTIFIRITFDDLQTLEGSLTKTFVLLRFFHVVIGRKQYVKYQGVRLDSEDSYLRVYSTMKQKSQHQLRDPHFSDLIVDPFRDKNEFCNVLQKWISLDKNRLDARAIFNQNFAKANSFSQDRLTAVANMYDLLPEDALEEMPHPSPEISNARDESHAIWRQLPISPERESILSALGRLGKPSLRSKIYNRLNLINNPNVLFPELEFVVDKAVNCRNYFVHGGKKDFDYYQNMNIVFFLAETLEMIFGMSEFVECGWDINKWCQNGTVMSHPFAAYRVNYQENLDNLKMVTLP